MNFLWTVCSVSCVSHFDSARRALNASRTSTHHISTSYRTVLRIQYAIDLARRSDADQRQARSIRRQASGALWRRQGPRAPGRRQLAELARLVCLENSLPRKRLDKNGVRRSHAVYLFGTAPAFLELSSAGQVVCFAARSQSPDQDQHDHDDEDQAQAAARIVAPAGAVRPSRQRADQQQNKYDDENGSEHGSSQYMEGQAASGRSPAGAFAPARAVVHASRRPSARLVMHEDCQQNDDRQRDADQPKQQSTSESHSASSCVSICPIFNGGQRSLFRTREREHFVF